MPPATLGFVDVRDTSLPQEKTKQQVKTKKCAKTQALKAELGLFLLDQDIEVLFLKQTAGTIKLPINPHFFSRGNKKADTMIQKVQKEPTTKEWKSAICLRNYHLICIIGGLGCSSVPGGCVFIARLFAVINFSSAPDFLKGGRGRLLLNNEWHAFILSLKCPWCYNMKRQR